ncbi:MAG: hypothetical protein ABEJ56_00065 [Candidatus Nanohaloarchaea archaeon]
MPYKHENHDCTSRLQIYRKGPSPETSTWYCPECDAYTNEIEEVDNQ